MRKKVLPFLKCPETQHPEMKLVAVETMRNGKLLAESEQQELLDEDDVISGLLINEKHQLVYPIAESIAILLAKSDVDTFHHIPLLENMKKKCQPSLHTLIESTILHLQKVSPTFDGNWNRDEMRYYDAEVETPEKRSKMMQAIKNTPVHRILIPRKKHITDIISSASDFNTVLEIGCGNASTVYRIFNPATYHYRYIGSDISFKRLIVAKKMVPEGDFIQASALNLPFAEGCFSAIISFGMLHHLPRPVDAVNQVIPLIKSNGLFAFHEPVMRPDVKFPGKEIIKKAMSTYEHSEHDGKIDLDGTISTLTNASFKTLHQSFQISPVRSIAETIIKRFSRRVMLNMKVIQFIEIADNFLLKHTNKRFGKPDGKAVFQVMQKSV